jgi:hypothetical protein
MVNVFFELAQFLTDSQFRSRLTLPSKPATQLGIHMERIGDWYVVLVKNVRGVDPLLTAVESGSLPCSLIRGELVASRLHLAVAIHRLSLNPNLLKRAGQIAPNTQLLVGLSPKPSAALKTFGFTGEVAPGTADSAQTCAGRVALLALKEPSPSLIAKAIELSKGTVIPLTLLEETADRAAIAQVYGVTEPELAVGTLADAVVTRIATMDV